MRSLYLAKIVEFIFSQNTTIDSRELAVLFESLRIEILPVKAELEAS